MKNFQLFYYLSGVEFYAFKEHQRKTDALITVASDKIDVQPFEAKHLEYLVGI